MAGGDKSVAKQPAKPTAATTAAAASTAAAATKVAPAEVTPGQAGSSAATLRSQSRAAAASSSDRGTTLLEMEDREAAKPKRRALKRKASDAVIDQIIRDNFKGWSECDLNAVVFEGMDLKTRLKTDKKRKKEDNLSMGKRYYDWLREKYAPDGSPSKLLKVKDTTQGLDDELVTALTNAGKQQPLRSQLSLWLGNNGATNQRTVVGIMRFVMQLRPHQSAAQREILKEIMQWMSRNEIATNYAEELQHTRGALDSGLRCFDGCYRSMERPRRSSLGCYR